MISVTMGNFASKTQKTTPRPPSPPLPSRKIPMGPTIGELGDISEVRIPECPIPVDSPSYPLEPAPPALSPVPEEDSPIENKKESIVYPVIPMFRRETDNELPDIEAMETERRKSVRLEDDLYTSAVSMTPSRNVEVPAENVEDVLPEDPVSEDGIHSARVVSSL
jgi:hypothetical protein